MDDKVNVTRLTPKLAALAEEFRERVLRGIDELPPELVGKIDPAQWRVVRAAYRERAEAIVDELQSSIAAMDTRLHRGN